MFGGAHVPWMMINQQLPQKMAWCLTNRKMHDNPPDLTHWLKSILHYFEFLTGFPWNVMVSLSLSLTLSLSLFNISIYMFIYHFLFAIRSLVNMFIWIWFILSVSSGPRGSWPSLSTRHHLVASRPLARARCQWGSIHWHFDSPSLSLSLCTHAVYNINIIYTQKYIYT